MSFLPHQIDTAKTAIEEMNGRAILADEVGLGKTIEAGLIMKELMVRGLVHKALILVPASLVSQWAQELQEKFYIRAIPYRKNMAWDQSSIIISSIDTAKRDAHREIIQDIDYDLLLIDEAHKLKNHQTKNYDFVKQIRKKYCLMLTATPIQNKLMELFNLVSILKPGHLGSYDMFLKRYGNHRHAIQENEYLRKLIQKVMIRNTRESTQLQESKRNIETVWVDFSPLEMELYRELEQVTESFSPFSKITLLREYCSSKEACMLSLQKVAQTENAVGQLEPLIEKFSKLPHHAKSQKVLDIIQKAPNEKIIIFTEYRASQLYLQWFLQQHDIRSVPFRGGFKRGKKDWMKQLFENHAQVLIATEAGGEGINLQFCKNLINYDLPWNPMRLEQRIGRIHRYGQKSDVHIYNLSIRDTFEEQIIKVLYEKIKLFERVIGELDDILSALDIPDIEQEIQTIFTQSTSPGEAKIKLENLSSVIERHTNASKEDEAN